MWQQSWWAIYYLAVTRDPPRHRPSILPGYTDVGVIPAGARDILVQEVEEAGNFLALRGESSEEYFLNGNYIIQWNGEYEAGGTTFYYERSGNMENLTAPGPTKEPVILQVGRHTADMFERLRVSQQITASMLQIGGCIFLDGG